MNTAPIVVQNRFVAALFAGAAALAIVLVFGAPAAAGQGREGEAGHRRGQPGELTGVIEDLERAMNKLRELKRMDLLELVERAAGAAKETAAHERDESAAGDQERDIARRQLAVMRHAVKVLADAGRPDSAELMELRIRAGEMGLEEHDCEEARRIRAKSPNRPQTFELLNFAAHHADKQGKGEVSEALTALAEQIYGAQHRAAVREEEAARRQGEERSSRQEERNRDARPDERILQLQKQIERLAQAVEKLHGEVQELRERKQ